MKHDHPSNTLWWQKKSDSSSDILANACECVLRRCAVLFKQTFLGSRNLLTLGGWASMLHTARLRLRRSSLLR
jgi:hypothetical protein